MIKFKRFELETLRIVGADSFEDQEQVELPFIISGVAVGRGLRVPDNVYVADQGMLLDGPADIWIDLPERWGLISMHSRELEETGDGQRIGLSIKRNDA